MKHNVLWKFCQGAYDTFNPNRTNLDIHCDQFFEENQINEENDRIFIKEVLYGVTRFEKVLKSVFNGFITVHKETHVTKKTHYLILSYIIIFRFGEIPIKELKKLLRGNLTVTQVATFLEFLCNKDHVQKYLIPEWLKVYDKPFVNEKLVEDLSKNTPAIMQYIEDLKRTARGDKRVEKPKQCTVPVPFNITKPKRVKIPLPYIICTEFKRNEVPETTYKAPKTTFKPRGKKETQKPDEKKARTSGGSGKANTVSRGEPATSKKTETKQTSSKNVQN